MKKKCIALLTVLVLAFCLPMTAFAGSTLVTYGSRGTLVKQIQMNLNGLNFSCGTADGIAGDRTVAAIRSFQQNAAQNGLVTVSSLAVDGKAGSATQSALFSIIRTLQQGLNKLGYSVGSVDGVYGNATSSAVRRFQRDYGLSADGIAGPKTRTALSKALNSSGAPGSVTTSSSLKDFQNYALANWQRPISASILTVGSGRQFGSSRTDGRLHAGIDWFVNNGAGTPVYAMASGTVEEYNYNTFYGGTGMLSIKHTDGSVARYGEVTPLVTAGTRVQKGQKIAVLKANSYNGGTMLHLELYRGTATGSLTVPGNWTYDYVADGNYQRRRDILNPSFLLGL